MQAQMQSTNRPTSSSRGWPTELAWIAGLYVFIHAVWLSVPSFIDTDGLVGPLQYTVTSVSLGLGLIAILAISRGMRWGLWMMLVLMILNILITVPEVFALEGALRVVSIGAALTLATISILLFRPGVRKGS